MPLRYMKEYAGVTSGTLGGRDDGYPVIKRKFYGNMASLIREHGTEHDEKYFIIHPMPPADFNYAYERHKIEEQRIKDEAERAKDEAEFKRLAEKLGKQV